MTQLERILRLQLKKVEDIYSYTNEQLIYELKTLRLPYDTEREINLEKVLCIYYNRDLLKLHFVTDMAKIERRLTRRE